MHIIWKNIVSLPAEQYNNSYKIFKLLRIEKHFQKILSLILFS